MRKCVGDVSDTAGKTEKSVARVESSSSRGREEEKVGQNESRRRRWTAEG